MIYSISMILLPKREPLRGQMLIGILVAIAIFLILSHALFTLISSSYSLLSYNRARITARHLAEEKMETIRNLVYSDIGTVGGIPAGIIPQTESVTRNGLNFTINTEVIFVDDPYDNLAPSDTSPEDYKKARVQISWEGVGKSGKNPLVLISDFAANTTTDIDAGSLVILVFDANGNPVPQADVAVVANSVNPPVNLSLQTDSDGRVIIPGATPCVACYRITVTKSGFSTDRTYAVSEVANPIKPDTSVFTDDVTQISFAIDVLSNLAITSVDSRENSFVAKGNVSFRIHGNKIIGTDAYAQNVYKYDQTFSTDSGGSKNLNNIEWDVYQILMPPSTSNDISGTSPILPLNLTPGSSLDFKFAVSPHTTHSFFLTAKDPGLNQIASASAHLTNSSGYDQTQTTGISGDPDYGETFFSNLTEDTYQISATASGFLDYSGSFDVSGTTNGTVVLTPQ